MPRAWLALGDSYTAGEGVAHAGCWPMQLAARLRAVGIDVADPCIIATTGWTTDELDAALDAATLAPAYALVTLLVGVNNQYRGRSLGGYREQFRGLLRRAVVLAGGRAAGAVVVSIPDWGVTPFAARKDCEVAEIARAIDAFNAAARQETGRAGARWVDVTGISRQPAMRAEVVADGLHPSAAQYAHWVEAILPQAQAALTGA